MILPEGISLFGQSLTPRFAASIDLITGSLPAQYGLVTTGIVDIQTKSGAFKPGGSVGLYGGSHGWMEPSIEYAGSAGNFNYYVSGDYMQNGIGIENPTASNHPLHDDTEQAHGFAYARGHHRSLDSKISAILGFYQGRFQIPDNPGQTPAFPIWQPDGVQFVAAQRDPARDQRLWRAVLSECRRQHYDFQLSAFERYSRLSFTPDAVGDLMFYGLAQTRQSPRHRRRSAGRRHLSSRPPTIPCASAG